MTYDELKEKVTPTILRIKKFLKYYGFIGILLVLVVKQLILPFIVVGLTVMMITKLWKAWVLNYSPLECLYKPFVDFVLDLKFMTNEVSALGSRLGNIIGAPFLNLWARKADEYTTANLRDIPDQAFIEKGIYGKRFHEISLITGINQMDNRLTQFGGSQVKDALHFLDPNHCIKTVQRYSTNCRTESEVLVEKTRNFTPKV